MKKYLLTRIWDFPPFPLFHSLGPLRRRTLPSSSHSLSLSRTVQCDQMAAFIFLCLAIYDNKNYPNSIKILSKYFGSNFWQMLPKPLMIA